MDNEKNNKKCIRDSVINLSYNILDVTLFTHSLPLFSLRFPPPSSSLFVFKIDAAYPLHLSLSCNALFTTRSIMQIVACDRNIENETSPKEERKIQSNMKRTKVEKSQL